MKTRQNLLTKRWQLRQQMADAEEWMLASLDQHIKSLSDVLKKVRKKQSGFFWTRSHKYACATTYQSAKGLVWLISNHHSAHLPTTQTCLLCKRLKSVSGEWANGIQSSSFNRAKLKLLFHPNGSFEELQALESWRRHASPSEGIRTSVLHLPLSLSLSLSCCMNQNYAQESADVIKSPFPAVDC